MQNNNLDALLKQINELKRKNLQLTAENYKIKKQLNPNLYAISLETYIATIVFFFLILAYISWRWYQNKK